MRRREEALIDAFRSAQAVMPAARPLAEINVADPELLSRFRDLGVIREAMPGRYCLDEIAWKTHRQARLRRALVLALIVMLLGIGMGVATWIQQGR